jgi:hypothetical protein
MSTQSLTYEGILKLFEESDRRFDKRMEDSARETAKRLEESDKRLEQKLERVSSDIGKLGSRVGDLVEHMIGGKNVVEQFQDLGYDVTEHSRDIMFGEKGNTRQIDLLLDDGDVAILIEVKTKLTNDGVLDHIERLEAYRRWKDSRGTAGKKRYIGALACAIVAENVVKFAQKKGLYVIVQLGNTVKIVDSPEGFKAKEW